MIYTGKTNERNGIGVMLVKAMKTRMKEMIRKRDHIIVVKIVLEASIASVV